MMEKSPDSDADPEGANALHKLCCRKSSDDHDDEVLLFQARLLLETDPSLVTSERFVEDVGDGKAYPLHYACWEGFVPMIEMLVNEFSADVNITSTMCHDTPLGSAVSQEHVEVVQFLLNNNADPDLARTDGQTPLFYACENQHTPQTQAIVELLLEKGAHVNVTDINFERPLHWAISSDNVWAAQILLFSGAEFPPLRRCPLQVVFEAGEYLSFEMVQFLVASGLCRLDSQFPWDYSPLTEFEPLHMRLLAWIRHIGILDSVVTSYPSWPLLAVAIDAGLHDVAKWLLQTGRSTTTRCWTHDKILTLASTKMGYNDRRCEESDEMIRDCFGHCNVDVDEQKANCTLVLSHVFWSRQHKVVSPLVRNLLMTILLCDYRCQKIGAIMVWYHIFSFLRIPDFTIPSLRKIDSPGTLMSITPSHNTFLLAQSFYDLHRLTPDRATLLRPPVDFDALCDVVQDYERALDAQEAELDHELDTELDDELDDAFDEIDNDVDDEIDNDVDDEIDNDLDDEIDNDEIDIEADGEIDIEVDGEIDNEGDEVVDNDVGDEMDNDVDDEIDNDEVDEIGNEVDDEIDNILDVKDVDGATEW